MPFQNGDRVKVTEDIPDLGITAENKGTVTGAVGTRSYWVVFDGKLEDVIVPERILAPVTEDQPGLSRNDPNFEFRTRASTEEGIDRFAKARGILVTAIRPALQVLGKGGRAAEQLLLGTAIQESLLIHRQQFGGGPALGLFQMEPATHNDCWQSYLNARTELASKVKQTLAAREQAAAATMKTNDRYSAAMCRILYVRGSDALPAPDDIQAMAHYWKKHYNTILGAGKPEEFLAKWPQYVNAHTFD